MILIPKRGKLVRNSGSMAQWIAQASEAPTPKASQLIRIFMKGNKIKKKQQRCKINI